jgi:hypothetical protein
VMLGAVEVRVLSPLAEPARPACDCVLEMLFSVDWMPERLVLIDERLESTVVNPLVTEVERAAKLLVTEVDRLVRLVCSEVTADWTLVSELAMLVKEVWTFVTADWMLASDEETLAKSVVTVLVRDVRPLCRVVMADWTLVSELTIPDNEESALEREDWSP